MIERLANILPKRVPGPSRTNTPSTPIVGVTPQQIAHGPLVRHFLDPIQRPNVIQCIDAGTQPAVEAEDLCLDESREREVVEEIGEVFPDGRVAVFSKAFIVKAVDLGDLT